MSIVLPKALSAFSAQEEEMMRDMVVETSCGSFFSAAAELTSTLVVPVSAVSLTLERTYGYSIH